MSTALLLRRALFARATAGNLSLYSPISSSSASASSSSSFSPAASDAASPPNPDDSTVAPSARFSRATTENLSLYSLISSSYPSASSPAASDSNPPPNPDDSAVVFSAVEVIRNHRGASRWSALSSHFPGGLTPPQISGVLLQIRADPRLSHAFFNFAIRHPSLSSSPPLHCYAVIINILARSHLLTRVRPLLSEALRISGPGPGSGSVDGELGHERHKLFRELLETYGICKSSPLVFDLLIRSNVDAHHLDDGIDIVRLLRPSGFYPNATTCNVLISAASRCKGADVGYDLYRELLGFYDDRRADEREFRGVRRAVKPKQSPKVDRRAVKAKQFPNVDTFNKLMLAFYRAGAVDMVEQFWIEMRVFNCTPNIRSYGILMDAYCEQGDVEKGLTVFEELRSKGFKPDVDCYNALIGGYCKMGEIAKGEELYKEMGLSGMKSVRVTYQYLLNGYCFVGDVDAAMLVFNDMHRKGFSPDHVSIDSMIRLLCDKKSPSEALEFFTNVTRDTEFVAKETNYESLIKGLCGEGNMDKALLLQAQMVGKGFKPGSHIYGAFIDGYVKLGKPDIAERLRKEMMAAQELCSLP